MELDEHQEWASELERHRGSKFVWVQFYFHHIGMEALQVCSALQWDTRVASKGLCRSSPLMLHIISKTIASNTQPSYTLKATRMHIKFPPNDPCVMPLNEKFIETLVIILGHLGHLHGSWLSKLNHRLFAKSNMQTSYPRKQRKK